MSRWVVETISSTGYLGVVALMFVENVFPPIPSELIMPLAGYLAAQDRLVLPLAILAGTAGSVLGVLPLYGLGRWLGEERLRVAAARHGHWLVLRPDDVDRASRWFDRFGAWAVLVCRLVPGVRSLISVPAGVARMPLGLFLPLSTIGTAAWASLLAFLGRSLGRNYEIVGQYVGPFGGLVLAGVVGLYVVRVIRLRRRRGNGSDVRRDREPGAAVILDTNVIVAAGFRPESASGRILASVRAGALRMVWSREIRTEIEQVVGKIPPLAHVPVDELFHADDRFDGELRPDRYREVEDPSDRKFAALAEASGATLITSDDDLLGPRDRLDLAMATPSEFVRTLEGDEDR